MIVQAGNLQYTSAKSFAGRERREEREREASDSPVVGGSRRMRAPTIPIGSCYCCNKKALMMLEPATRHLGDLEREIPAPCSKIIPSAGFVRILYTLNTVIHHDVVEN